MSEEPSLPRLPTRSWDEQTQGLFNGSRKRGRAQCLQNDSPQNFNSSDPAVFSSDDDPGLDNYVEGRRKKRYVGSWFQQHPASSDSAFGEGIPRIKPIAKPKRKLARQVDSGVFLGSDGTESEDMLESLDVPMRSRLPQLERPAPPRMSTPELEARRKIEKSLEDGSETIDFWSMGLETLSNETVEPLSQLTCIPQITKDVAFEQRDPDLKIYLAQNLLTRLPGALFDLVNITTLSLRSNRLTELPPSISKLRNLKELNVSLNRLKHLPVELLDLLDTAENLHTLVLHPNPFVQPDPLPADEATAAYEKFLSLRASWKDPKPKFVSQHLCRSPVQESATSGRILSDFTIPTEASALIPVEGAAPGSSSPAKSLLAAPVPSLLEAALRSCYDSGELPALAGYLSDELSHLRPLLDRAARQKESGGLSCSRCRRLVVVPALEWIEWRTVYSGSSQASMLGAVVSNGEFAVPFLHRGCSARCGPRDGRDNCWMPARIAPDE